MKTADVFSTQPNFLGIANIIQEKNRTGHSTAPPPQRLGPGWPKGPGGSGQEKSHVLQVHSYGIVHITYRSCINHDIIYICFFTGGYVLEQNPRTMNFDMLRLPEEFLQFVKTLKLRAATCSPKIDGTPC